MDENNVNLKGLLKVVCYVVVSKTKAKIVNENESKSTTSMIRTLFSISGLA